MIELIGDPLAFDFMQRALMVSIAAAIACSLISCWLVLIGWSLMGDAVSHAVLPGVVLAYMLGLPFALGALAFALLAVVLIGGIRESSQIKEDAAIGIVFTTLFAFGLVLVSVVPSQVDLGHILFGNILGVSDTDLAQVIGLGTLTLGFLVWKRRDLTLFAFDPAHAQAIGLSPRRLSALLLGFLAVTSVVALQAVGVILVVAMLILPGATAYLLTKSIWRMLVVAPVVATLSAVLGIYLSYYLDTASGPMIVLTHAFFFTVAHLFSPGQGLVVRAARASRHRTAV